MALISPDKDKCVQCRACSDICPMEVIFIDEQGYPSPKANAFKLCINCGYCVDVCAFDALTHAVRKRNSTAAAALKRLKRKKALQKK